MNLLQDHPPSGIHSEASSLREQYLEYAFIGALCEEMWKRGKAMDILRSHTDRSGYDILLETDGIQRHVQLKSSFVGAKTAHQKINIRLAEKPSGCIVWIRFQPDTLELTDFLWFGGAPGEPLPELGNKPAKHTKGDRDGMKGERAMVRLLNRGRFSRVGSTGCLSRLLF